MILLLLQILGAIGRQDLPREGCAAYLWTVSEPRQLVAMAEPGLLRLSLDGRPLDLARTAAEGSAGLGLAAVTRYAAGEVSATLELVVQEQPNMTKGALAPAATLTIARAGGDAMVTPVAGMVGCR